MPVFLLDMVEDPDDRRAFEVIYEHYQQMLFYEAKEMLNDDGAAEDAVLETFTRLAKNFQKSDKKICHRLRSFLVIINRNVCVDMLRTRHTESPAEPDVLADEIYSTEPDPVTYARAEETCMAISGLPAIYRDVLYLSRVLQYDDRDISAFLHVSQSTVRKRLERGLKILRKELGYDR